MNSTSTDAVIIHAVFAASDTVPGIDSATGEMSFLTPTQIDALIGLWVKTRAVNASTTLPGEPCTPGSVHALLDVQGDAVLYFCADGAWAPVMVSPSDTIDTVFTRGRVIDGATAANPLEVGNGTQALEIFGDATLSGVIRPKPLGDSAWRCWTNYNCVIRDEEGAAAMFTIDPDATDNDKYVWASGYRPIKTLSLPADALYVAGAATLVTDAALISGGLVSPYITITDSNSDYFYRYVRMPPTWDGGTVTATITVVNVNATPANAFEVDVSGECYPAGAALGTTISTTGEQAATITFGSSGSCGGSACNQNDPASATTAAITLNGTPAGGNLCGFQAQVDATATTETVAGIKVIQMDIHYKISKGF